MNPLQPSGYCTCRQGQKFASVFPTYFICVPYVALNQQLISPYIEFTDCVSNGGTLFSVRKTTFLLQLTQIKRTMKIIRLNDHVNEHRGLDSLLVSQRTLLEFMYHSQIFLSVGGSVRCMIRNLRYTVTIDSVLANSNTQNNFLFTVNAIFGHDYPLAVEPGSKPRPLEQKTWRDSLHIDMLLSAVSVLVFAQSSSEIPEGLMNNPV